MGRFLLAWRCFFGILFHGHLSDQAVQTLGLSRAPERSPVPAAPPPPAAKPADGALQILSILQRDARLIDFLMEDIGPYSDEQVGAAVRSLHDQCRESLSHYIRLAPVIDGVEGTFTSVAASNQQLGDASTVKFLGNVPAKGLPAGGVLRHKGWRVEKVELPPIAAQPAVSVIAPAEIEVE